MSRTNVHVDGSIGERVRARRLELGMSQRELECAGVSYAYISRIESNSRVPSLSAVIILADRLGTSALWLLTGDAHSECPLCGHATHGGRRNGSIHTAS